MEIGLGSYVTLNMDSLELDGHDVDIDVVESFWDNSQLGKGAMTQQHVKHFTAITGGMGGDDDEEDQEEQEDGGGKSVASIPRLERSGGNGRVLAPRCDRGRRACRA